MTRLLAAIAACVLTTAAGYVHGLWTDRWGGGAEPAAAFARYEQIPLELGDWQGEPLEVKDAPADATGTIQRRYTNRRTGDAVVMALVCGRPGPVAIHTPDACYGASGFTVSTPVKATADGAGEFWTAEAVRSRAAEETRLRVYWGWSAGGGWAAPDSPRTAYARARVLHKVYVLREASPVDAGREEPCLAFLRAFVPALDPVLFPPAEPTAAP